jgi:hypothetical protein
VLFKKTNELSKAQVKGICELFETVFCKTMPSNDFFKKFTQNIKGYSYHSILLNDNNEIVGCYSSIPYEYNYFGDKLLFGLSVDTMIKKEYRGNPFTFKKLAKHIYGQMKKDGISFVFGFPNDNVYLVRKKILKWKDIGKLNYYILPINIGVIKTKLKYLNFLSRAYAVLVNVFSGGKVPSNNIVSKIKKSNIKDFRYDASYKIVEFHQGYVSYKIYDEDGVRTAYLIDIYPLSKWYVENAVKTVFTEELDNIDIIIYVGNIKFNVKNLIKVPKRYEPKTIHMSGVILNTTNVDDRVFDLNAWEVNLSNYDVR